VPRSILEKVERYFRFFLWYHNRMRRYIHAVAWDTISRDIVEDGLGIRELKPLYQTLMAKQVVRTITNQGSI